MKMGNDCVILYAYTISAVIERGDYEIKENFKYSFSTGNGI